MSFWTDDRVDALKEHWAKGHSASRIAVMIGANTRNQIIGKVHRLGLAGRPDRNKLSKRQKDLRYAERQRQAAARREKVKAAQKTGSKRIMSDLRADPTVQALLQAPAADVALVHSVVDLEPHHCRYVVGEPSDGHFCGKTKVDGLPYCAGHAARCYGREDQRPMPSVRAAIRHEAEALKAVQEFVEA